MKTLECNCYSCMIKAVSITALKYCRGYTQHARLYYFIVSGSQSCYLQKINSYTVVITEHYFNLHKEKVCSPWT